ncbi:MAG: peptide chain release factor-like protein [Phycisphaerales bacterium]
MDLSFLDKPAERDPHPAQLPDETLLAQCRLGRSRKGGPGGQHRNKVETAVTLTHEPTGIGAQASERRSAETNRKVALRRLRLKLATEVRGPVPAGDARSDLWRARTRSGRIACSTRHHDYPAMLAEALDFIAACAWDQSKAAARLEVTPTQLVKLVSEHAPAMTMWNDARSAHGLRPLH